MEGGHKNESFEKPDKRLLELAVLARDKYKKKDRLTLAQAAAEMIEELVGPRDRFPQKEFVELIGDIVPYMKVPDSYPLTDNTLGKDRPSEEEYRAYAIKRLVANDNSTASL